VLHRYHGKTFVTCLVRSCMEVTLLMTGTGDCAELTWKNTCNLIRCTHTHTHTHTLNDCTNTQQIIPRQVKYKSYLYFVKYKSE